MTRIRGMIAIAAAGAAVATVLSRRAPNASLKGHVVLITGGSRGLGLALARQFAHEGAQLAICARVQEELDRARHDLLQRGARVLAIPCDVSDPEQVKSLIRQTISHYGRLDILVNNAGLIQVGPIESMSITDFENAMNVMFWGHVYTTLAVLPHMRQQGAGRIVNITSVGGKVSVPHLTPYSCAKFAAAAFSEGMRAELNGTGVKVVTIAPGLMRTGSYLNAVFKGDQQSEFAWFGAGASLPGISMSASRAAAQIVRATREGSAERILGVPANLLARVHGLFPGITADLLGLINRALPAAKDGEHGRRRKRLARHAILWVFTILGRRAAREFLQPAARVQT